MSTGDRAWAWEEFRSAKLGDARLNSRLIQMATRVAQRPSGLVATVFKDPAERQATYDFLSNDAVRAEQVTAAAAAAALERCRDERVIFVPIDGSSITLSDPSKTKRLGSVGARKFPTRGLQVMTALAVEEDGTPAGLLDLQAWVRPPKSRKSRFRRRAERETEMQYLTGTIDAVLARVTAAAVWIVIDRGGDEGFTLQQLASSRATFTVRAAQNRIVEHGGKRRKLFSVARSGKLLATRSLELGATGKRKARTAVVEVRATETTLMLPPREGSKKRVALKVGVVEIREVGNRRDKVNWVLLTNHPVTTIDEVDRVVRSYRLRWRIEEYHRGWKRGGCNVEDIQLRSVEGIRKWATLLGSMAARAERLKYLARTQPDAPATIELSEVEIRALVIAKRQIKTSVEVVPDGIPTIEKATLWIADLGGYAGHYKKGRRPGTTTISRGLEDLAIWTAARIAFEAEQKGRRR
jgi:hypothetical protein